MVAAFSASGPIMKPGSSTKLTIGRWKLSHISTKRRILRAPSAVMEPLDWKQSFAMMPTGCPPRRASAVICERPKAAVISKKEPWSNTSWRMRRIL